MKSIALFVCPVAPERSRVWFRLAVNDVASSDATLRAFQDMIQVLRRGSPRSFGTSEPGCRIRGQVSAMVSARYRAVAAYAAGGKSRRIE